MKIHANLFFMEFPHCEIKSITTTIYHLSDMTRSELIAGLIIKLAAQHPQLTGKDIELAAITILDGISNTLVKRGRVEIRGFGSFGINKRPPRKGRNPKTGATVMVPAKEVPHFKAGKELRERVDYD